MTELEQFIQDEIDKMKGVSIPAHASALERLLVMKTNIRNLHPNPEDEFCFPDIGPNFGIISSYVAKFNFNIKRALPLMDEPLFVQKIRPHGYMILNGHHRWAAALRVGVKRVPVRVVNSVFEADIKKMLEESENDKRATFDLDEVIFRTAADPDVEKAPGILRFGIRRKRLRLGIPALFRFLQNNGYDIWVYSADYYSIDDIRDYFAKYAVTVDGVITGTKKKRKDGGSEYSDVEKLISGKYKETIHVDNDLVLVTHSMSKDFDEAQIRCSPAEWSREVIAAVEGFAKEQQ